MWPGRGFEDKKKTACGRVVNFKKNGMWPGIEFEKKTACGRVENLKRRVA